MNEIKLTKKGLPDKRSLSSVNNANKARLAKLRLPRKEKLPKGKVGRPRKVENSDTESDDEELELLRTQLRKQFESMNQPAQGIPHDVLAETIAKTVTKTLKTEAAEKKAAQDEAKAKAKAKRAAIAEAKAKGTYNPKPRGRPAKVPNPNGKVKNTDPVVPEYVEQLKEPGEEVENSEQKSKKLEASFSEKMPANKAKVYISDNIAGGDDDWFD